MAKGLSGWGRSIWPGQIGGEVAARQTAGAAWQLAKASKARVAWGKARAANVGAGHGFWGHLAGLVVLQGRCSDVAGVRRRAERMGSFGLVCEFQKFRG